MRKKTKVTYDIFQDTDSISPWTEPICKDAAVLRHYALANAREIIQAVKTIIQAAPFRHMYTPGGHRMSAALTAAGARGWISDCRGYRYSEVDPITSQSWPPLPSSLEAFATEAANAAGFPGFHPDACLINCYEPGAKMSLHQDKDEADLSAPIVSISLGLSARFLFGGLKRSDPTIKIPLNHGDIVVWGGEARLNFHGISPIRITPKTSLHPILGHQRWNLTFRKTR